MKHINKYESMIHQRTLDQMKKVSDIMGKSNIGEIVSDDSFSNAIGSTKKNVFKHGIQTYDQFLNEPFKINQNRTSKKKVNESNILLTYLTKEYDNKTLKTRKKLLNILNKILTKYFESTNKDRIDFDVIHDYFNLSNCSVSYLNKNNGKFSIDTMGDDMYQREIEIDRMNLEDVYYLLYEIISIPEIIGTYSNESLVKINESIIDSLKKKYKNSTKRGGVGNLMENSGKIQNVFKSILDKLYNSDNNFFKDDCFDFREHNICFDDNYMRGEYIEKDYKGYFIVGETDDNDRRKVTSRIDELYADDIFILLEEFLENVKIVSCINSRTMIKINK